MMLSEYLKGKAAIINAELSRRCSGRSRIDRAMRYSLLAGGKRLRPILVLCAAQMFGAREKDVLPAACALEYIHTYSLIHDDLPAMDNDDLRRGKPTSHKKYGEATAILAGDALLTDAFALVAECSRSGRIGPENALRASAVLAEAAGRTGMIAGQMEDTVETGSWKSRSLALSAQRLRRIHMGKTAALIRGSLTIGAILAGAKKSDVARLGRYGALIGLAFQVADDILDIEGDKKLLGKEGSDRMNEKLTYPAVYGLDGSKKIAARLVADARAEAEAFGQRGRILAQLADYIISRRK